MFLNSVNVIFVGDSKTYLGMAIAWATQVEKNHILVSVPKDADCTSLLLENKEFTVSVLSNSQKNVAIQYGGSQQRTQIDKDLTVVDFSRWRVPVIREAAEAVLCSMVSVQYVESQAIVVGKVLERVVAKGAGSLVYDSSDYFA